MASVCEVLLQTLDDLVDEDLKRFRWHLQQPNLPELSPIPKAHLENKSRCDLVSVIHEHFGDPAAKKLAVEILKKMNKHNLVEKLANATNANEKPKTVQRKLKESLRERCSVILHEKLINDLSCKLSQVYTDLYIVKGVRGGVYTEHEIRQIDALPRMSPGDKPSIKSCDIFKACPEEKTPLRKMLTLGTAGVGKTLTVKKFILDWAEGKANSDIDYIFPLPFRNLNPITEKCSLVQLVHHHFPCTKSESTSLFNDKKVLFIFDGLDESRLDLNFAKNTVIRDVEHETTLGVLITNLIKGEMLPSALVWVTSRHAAASHALEYFHQVTEILGFSDEQKVEFIKKVIKEEDKANKVISNMRTSSSFRIMCSIPVFCWLYTSVHQHTDDQEIPTTLTGMYAEFLSHQIKLSEKKYQKTDNIVLKLGRLAFLQLHKGNLIFYEEDLRACGIDIEKASVYCGVCTQIFKQDSEIEEKRCFSFVHLSLQEFLAAVYVFHAQRNYNRNPVLHSLTGKLKWIVHHSLLDLYKTTIDEALQSKNCHLDLFLRFLLGLSLESNQKRLRKLLPDIKKRDHNADGIVSYLKEKIRSNISPERSINLFFCLDELKDDSLVEEVQTYVKHGSLASKELSPTQWSALVFLLLTSEDTQKLFDLKKYAQTEEGLRRLLPVVGNSNRSLLDQCSLTSASCKELASAMTSSYSFLRHLDVSDNNLQDSGVQMLADGLKVPHCKLETLRLSGCMVTEKGCSHLASALKDNPLHLKELDLSYNNPGDHGMNSLNERHDDPDCSLEKLSFDYCGPMRMVTGPQKYICELTLDPNTAHHHLSLLEGNRKVTWMKEDQRYPDHPDRFMFKEQVLCTEGLSRRCYWEVGWSGQGIHIGAAYKSLRRDGPGEDCWLGHNDESWKLHCSRDSYTAWHHKINIYQSVACSPKIGVFLDWEAGTLSFYNICTETNTLEHLHTFNETFKEPLYPGFRVLNASAWLNYNSGLSF
ncbi:NACHT, LRR and PYD domains-containing protein 3-like [Astyanax mexicanus]|uniref:NACHT, LRR and PYD domains-containing protein 3-like n=1 Tax=Astyanax mexicanus TaxID=7994 RepID=UPI0020CB3EFD|nr:NACHT, LRR and PYD domains-containing protein 3-like [Astyanax mexicanus]